MQQEDFVDHNMSDSNFQPFNDTNGPTINKTVITLTLLLSMTLPSQLVCLIGLSGNGVVLWFLCFGIQRNPFIVYILNLAAADLILLLCIAVTLLYILIIYMWAILPEAIETYLFYMRILFDFGYHTSLFLLTAISVERCLSVVFPIWYKCHRPKQLSTIASSLIWIFAIVVTILDTISCPDNHYSRNIPLCKAVLLSLTVLSIGIVCPLMILSSFALVINVQRRPKRCQHLKLYRVILLNVFVFLVTTFPTRLLMLLLYLRIITYNNFNYFIIMYAHILCASINSSANPYIYFLVGKINKTQCKGFFNVQLQSVFRSDHETTSRDVAVTSRVAGNWDGVF